jgi:crotonyl-CoA carboxylase/reductase
MTAVRDLYPLGEIPPLGVVPRRMLAAVIRRDRYGPPKSAFAVEEVPVPALGERQILVYVMAAGINYNNIWASLGRPLDVIAIRQKRGEPEDFHIGGSDGSGIVWAVGSGVTSVRVGDEVTLSSCRWDERAEDIRLGADPMTSTSQSVWGYEDNWGSFAQFTRVEEVQCYPKPPNLDWAASACFLGTGATVYRQLLGWPPNILRPGDPVLIWGGAGGLGSMAIQLARAYGSLPIAVVSDSSRADYCRRIGALGSIDRREFDHWGRLPDIGDTSAMETWTESARGFGRRIWDILGERRNPAIVLEHSGEDTIPTSIYVCDTAGMVVVCGGTSGYNADLDLRQLWMRQKRLQGSHFANRQQCLAFTRLVSQGRIDPCLSRTFEFADTGLAHQLMYENRHAPGNMAVLVNAARRGLREAPSAGS